MNNYFKIKTLLNLILELVKRHIDKLPKDFVDELLALIDAWIKENEDTK